MNYAKNGNLSLMDNPDDSGNLPYRLECVYSMKNFDLQSKEEIRELRDLCNEALSDIENNTMTENIEDLANDGIVAIDNGNNNEARELFNEILEEINE